MFSIHNKEGGKLKKGFTLIELLTVISIISMFSSITLPSLNSAREKSNDARRKQDLKTLANAFELYKEKTGSYAIKDGGCGYKSNDGNQIGDGQYWLNLNSTLNPTYYDTKSVAECLYESGAAAGIIQDPSGNVDICKVTTNVQDYPGCTIDGHAYVMCVQDNGRTLVLAARLESLPWTYYAQDGANAFLYKNGITCMGGNTSSSSYDYKYGINYAVILR